MASPAIDRPDERATHSDRLPCRVDGLAPPCAGWTILYTHKTPTDCLLLARFLVLFLFLFLSRCLFFFFFLFFYLFLFLFFNLSLFLFLFLSLYNHSAI